MFELPRNIGRAIVFIELGVPITAKQANRWVITHCVVLPRRGVAHIKEEFLSIETYKKEEEESSE